MKRVATSLIACLFILATASGCATLADAVNYMDFTEAVHISSREGRRVYLPLA